MICSFRAHPRRSAVALALLAMVPACREPAEARASVERAPQADSYITGFSTEGARHVRTIAGFGDPESVRYDPDQDVYFVSNVAGLGSARDNNGYIVRFAASNLDSSGILVQGGRNGVTLNAPKGMAIQGDTLWVTDIDIVRGFDRRSGASVGTIDFSAHDPVQLNDIAAGPDGLRVTDTGIHMVYEGNVHTGPDRLFAVDPHRNVRVVFDAPHLKLPNGVAWDARFQRWVVVSFDPFAGEIWTPRATGDTTRTIIRRGAGQLDGVEVLPNGALLFSSWADSAIHVFHSSRDVRVIRALPTAADIGLDTKRGRVLVPLSVPSQVQVWDLGRWWPTPANR